MPSDPARPPTVDDAVFTRWALEMYTDALTTVVDGGDHRPLVLSWLGRAFRARATGHIRVDLGEPRSALCLWRQESDEMASTIDFTIPETWSADTLEEVWYGCAARRFVIDWFASAHLSELPVIADHHGFTVVLLGTMARPDERDEARLTDVRRHLELLERARRTAPSVTPATPAPPSSVSLPQPTSREIEVLRLLSEGMLAREIAARMGVSERTVHKHLGNVYAKLGVHDRLLAVRRAEALGLLPPVPLWGVS
ncbi:MAG: LuxR C-terminal-related transcriptional regulator [Propioniciclava sp.]|uniref:helix-turn-helix transcriptional regulator n=1 Tax=Propioniciclava sp. TaxID=2038686 RepID=UPI0039E68D19